MKKNYLLLTIVLLLVNVLILRAQQDTVLIDFGDPGQVSISPWNNMTSQVTGTVIDNLLILQAVKRILVLMCMMHLAELIQEELKLLMLLQGFLPLPLVTAIMAVM